jgi:HD-GYP domain-containing protein (c-di-GMP phosphodiesterase class II)
LDQSIAGLVASEGTPLHLPELTQAPRPFIRAQAIEEEGFVAYSAVPLVSQGAIKGVLEVFHRSPLEADQEWRDFLDVLAGQAAIAIDSATLFQNLQRSNAELTAAYDATIEGWSRALDLRDKETEGHTQRVTEMSVRLARMMGITGADLTNVRRGALLHDIGKLGVPDAILLKPGKLTDEEWSLMRRHPTYAYEWLSPIAFLRPALDIPYCHHEKLDGTGYPRGLKAEQIPLAARIFAAVDIWDALRSDRPYRQGWPEDRVIEHIRSLAGAHLDPAVVDAFQRCLAANPIEPVAGSVATVTAVAGSVMPTAVGGVDRVEEMSNGRVGPPRSGRSGMTILLAEGHPDSARALRRTEERVVPVADGEERQPRLLAINC